MTPIDTWPTWPFTKLTPEDMAQLLEALKQGRIEEVGEALW